MASKFQPFVNNVRELVVPIFGSARNCISEVHVHCMRTLARRAVHARDVIKQLVGHPLVARIRKRLRPRIVAAEVEPFADSLVELHLQ